MEIPMRPDHGHLMADEVGQIGTNSGYSYLGRLKSLVELYGVMDSLERLKKLDFYCCLSNLVSL
nr:mannonate dehydratase [Aestuariicella hydrocarbonica]